MSPLKPAPAPSDSPRPSRALTWEAMVPAALHVESRQVQSDPSHLLKQPVPKLVHQYGILTVQLGRGGHEASDDGVDATWWQEM